MVGFKTGHWFHTLYALLVEPCCFHFGLEGGSADKCYFVLQLDAKPVKTKTKDRSDQVSTKQDSLLKKK